MVCSFRFVYRCFGKSCRWTTGLDYPEKDWVQQRPAEREQDTRDPFLFVFRARISRNNKVNGKKKRKKKRRKKSLKPVTPENRFQRLLPSKARCKQLASRAYFTERVSQWYTGRESFITHRVRTANFRKKSTLFLFFQPSLPP